MNCAREQVIVQLFVAVRVQINPQKLVDVVDVRPCSTIQMQACVLAVGDFLRRSTGHIREQIARFDPASGLQYRVQSAELADPALEPLTGVRFDQ